MKTKTAILLAALSSNAFGHCTWIDPGYKSPEYLRPGRLHEQAYWYQTDIFPRTPSGEIDLDRMNQMTELKLKMMQTIPCEAVPEPSTSLDQAFVLFGIVGFMFIGFCILTAKRNER